MGGGDLGIVGEEKIEQDMDDNFTSIHPCSCHCTGISLRHPAKKDNGAAAAMKKPAEEYRTRETQTNNHGGGSPDGVAVGNQSKKRKLNYDFVTHLFVIFHKAAIVAYSAFLLLFLFGFQALAVESTFAFSTLSLVCRSCPTQIYGWDILSAKNVHFIVKFVVFEYVTLRAGISFSLDAIRPMEWNKVSTEFMIVILLFLVEHLEMIRVYKNELHEPSNGGTKVPSGKDPSAGGLLLLDKQAKSPSAQ